MYKTGFEIRALTKFLKFRFIITFILVQFFKIYGENLWWTHVLLWGHWYPCYGLMVTSSLSFKARVGSFVHIWWMLTLSIFPKICFWCNTCWPLGSQHGNWVVLIYILMNKHWWGSRPGSIVQLPHSVRPVQARLCTRSSLFRTFWILFFFSWQKEQRLLYSATD